MLCLQRISGSGLEEAEIKVERTVIVMLRSHLVS